ncbi:peptide-methionine (S)-S-oxide reductase MsrA [Thiopseudomonas alkaliphila]|uniref:Peptide methionine sulfoxide reductase MsrA n=1 Tax=Thiopseudomonas alkaliphila TaxID=1697053 RepID=A0AAW7DWI7_9GAMM|nr:peptide-methionine (S)-S-oxide reductase MsrA [Thiopseudomonas alkaliphila]
MQSIHPIFQRPLTQPTPKGMAVAYFAMGCFWGAERRFWQQPGVYLTAVGYSGGVIDNPSYLEVCTGQTQHAEVVKVVYDPKQVAYWDLLTVFWESHDPTQGMRQGNDIGSQYRSVIYCSLAEQLELAEISKAQFQKQLDRYDKGMITTEIAMAPRFYYAETEHQQYLAKNPNGYCGLRGTGCALS